MGPILDMVAVSHDVESVSYKVSYDTYAHLYLTFLLRL
jgi:hypothetical protein